MPISSFDLFDERVLTDPYPFYEVLRGLGPVTRMERHGVWAVPGHEEVRSILATPDAFRTEDTAQHGPSRPGLLTGTVLAVDDEAHTRLRHILRSQLKPTAVARRRQTIQKRADRLVAERTADGGFDAVDLAREMVTGTVMDLMGLPEDAQGLALNKIRPSLSSSGAVDGPGGAEMPTERAMTALLRQRAARSTVRAGSWMGAIFQAVDSGRLDESEAVPLASAYATIGIDSTILGLAGTIVQLARDPEQWAQLREVPARAEAAFHESIRLDAPIQVTSRLATEPVDLCGVRLEAGDRVWLLLGAAGRDLRKWGPTAESYDLRRPHTDKHLSLGVGPHACPGGHLALMQARSLLRALADHCLTLAPAGPTTQAVHPILRGYQTAPIAIGAPSPRFGFRRVHTAARASLR
ncbi:cytochrome P450 [Streptomyces sp. NPDC001502]|uniref:cytochrome P450 n=1 Tax=Streptomyces sp. NPDC001502 TaxID=3364578 RepID=UPI0036883955